MNLSQQKCSTTALVMISTVLVPVFNDTRSIIVVLPFLQVYKTFLIPIRLSGSTRATFNEKLQHHFLWRTDQMSHAVRKPVVCICENKDADQLRGNREADQRLCFR